MAGANVIALDIPEDAPSRPKHGRRRDAQVAATRRRLIEAGFVAFGGRGYHATSMADVARAAGMSQGAAYNHFAGKEALFAAAFESFNPFDGLIETLSGLGRSGAGTPSGFDGRLRQALDAFGGSMVATSASGRDWFDLLLIDVLEFDCRHWRALYRRQRGGFAKAAGRLEASGHLASIGGAAALRALIAAVLGEWLVARLLAAGEGDDVRPAAGSGVLDVFLRGLMDG
jgi:AcrR family transcriptional regulator